MGDLIELASRLVAADTESSRGNVPVMGELADRLERAGFRCRLQRWGSGQGEKANLVAVAGPPEPGGLVLSGHLDIVPFADQPGWTRDPLRLELDDARVYGRGTSDMKVFLAQCVEAAGRLRPQRLERPVVVLFTSEEEVGCLGAGRVAPELDAFLGEVPTPQLAWIGEPTSWEVFHGHKGIAAFQVTVRGRGGHSSVPEAGVNAIAVAARALAAIGALQAERRARDGSAWAELHPEAPYTTVNFGTIQGGTASNMIAERCSFTVSYRPLPDEDPRDFHRDVVARLAEAELSDWGSSLDAKVEVGEPLVAPGLLSPRGTALERCLLEELGTRAGRGAPFCTDGGQLTRAGIHSLVCGPGELSQAHQPDESLPRDAFESGTGHILAVVARLCGPAAVS